MLVLYWSTHTHVGGHTLSPGAGIGSSFFLWAWIFSIWRSISTESKHTVITMTQICLPSLETKNAPPTRKDCGMYTNQGAGSLPSWLKDLQQWFHSKCIQKVEGSVQVILCGDNNQAATLIALNVKAWPMVVCEHGLTLLESMTRGQEWCSDWHQSPTMPWSVTLTSLVLVYKGTSESGTYQHQNLDT